MAQRRYQGRGGAGNTAARAAGGITAQQRPGVSLLGKVRRSQVISTYAIGSIVDLEAGSFMPLGLEDWEQQTRAARKTSFVVYEARLQAQLDVQEFRLAPIVEEVEGEWDRVDPAYSIPVVRFPKWHECPHCHRLGTQDDPFQLDADGRRLTCIGCGGKQVNPVRFVIACRNGHIDDFPWDWWAHRSGERGSCRAPTLFLKSRGKSASLGDLYVFCASCKQSTSLVHAFSPDGLKGLTCHGSRPWLIQGESCSDAPIRTLQRGASNIHFPVVASALSIPPVSEPVFQALDEHWSVFKALPKESLPAVLQGIAEELGVTVDAMLAAVESRLAIENGGASYTELNSRTEEYLALSASTADQQHGGGYAPLFENTVSDPPDDLAHWFDLIGAVSRLREVRALAGFSRIEPFQGGGDRILEALQNKQISPISKTPKRWLPAAEIRGEGIFLRIRDSSIREWIDHSPGIVSRAAELDRMARSFAADRGYTPDYRITPRLLLVHAFSHAMIRQLSIDCGYSSSSLRERLYISDGDDGAQPMSGLLIYTGTPDSEGSLGGLVRLADGVLINDAVRRALRAVRWCGSDPVCLETLPAQGGERISGAACHCCMLLPETACEKFNRELDRSAIVGAADGSFRGFFSSLIESSDKS